MKDLLFFRPNFCGHSFDCRDIHVIPELVAIFHKGEPDAFQPVHDAIVGADDVGPMLAVEQGRGRVIDDFPTDGGHQQIEPPVMRGNLEV